MINPATDDQIEALRTPDQTYGGPINEEQIALILKLVPGARRCAQGVLVGNNADGFMHITRILPKSDPKHTLEDSLYYPICTAKEVARLKELKSAHDYLLMVRAKAIVDAPRMLRVMAKRRMRWDKMGRNWSLTAFYETMNRPAKAYVARLPRKDQSVIRGTPFGFSAVLEANAVCMRSLVGDVITVSESLRQFYYFVLICLKGEAHGLDWRDCVDAGLIAVRIMKGAEAMDFDIDPRGVLPIAVEASIRGDVDAMIEFTFGHEFAHHLLGHLDALPDGTDVRHYAHQQEYQADRQAVLAIADRKARTRLAEAGYLVFFALHLIEQISANRSDGPRLSVSTSHPSAIKRLWALHGALGAAEAPRRPAILVDLQTIDRAAEAILARAETWRPDLLTFYGSIYLGGLGGRPREDRIDF